MFSLIYFEKFDPLNGKFDTEMPFSDRAEQWLERARILIRDMSYEDINSAIQLLDWVFNSEEMQIANLEALAVENNFNNRVHLGFDANELRLITKHFDLKSYGEDSELQLSQLFALCGINKLAETIEDAAYERNRKNVAPALKDYGVLDILTFNLLAAIDVIALAQDQRELEAEPIDITVELSKKLSLQNSKAAIVRHAPTSKLKAKFIVWYFQNKERKIFTSRTQAADKFYNALSPEEKILSISNYNRTLLDALRVHENRKTH